MWVNAWVRQRYATFPCAWVPCAAPQMEDTSQAASDVAATAKLDVAAAATTPAAGNGSAIDATPSASGVGASTTPAAAAAAESAGTSSDTGNVSSLAQLPAPIRLAFEAAQAAEASGDTARVLPPEHSVRDLFIDILLWAGDVQTPI